MLFSLIIWLFDRLSSLGSGNCAANGWLFTLSLDNVRNLSLFFRGYI